MDSRSSGFRNPHFKGGSPILLSEAKEDDYGEFEIVKGTSESGVCSSSGLWYRPGSAALDCCPESALSVFTPLSNLLTFSSKWQRLLQRPFSANQTSTKKDVPPRSEVTAPTHVPNPRLDEPCLVPLNATPVAEAPSKHRAVNWLMSCEYSSTTLKPKFLVFLSTLILFPGDLSQHKWMVDLEPSRVKRP